MRYTIIPTETQPVLTLRDITCRKYQGQVFEVEDAFDHTFIVWVVQCDMARWSAIVVDTGNRLLDDPDDSYVVTRRFDVDATLTEVPIHG